MLTKGGVDQFMGRDHIHHKKRLKSGSVGHLIVFSGVDLKLKSSGKELAVIAPVSGEKLPTIAGQINYSID